VFDYVEGVLRCKADGLVADVYAEIRHDFGAVVEPFTLHSPAPDLLAALAPYQIDAELIDAHRAEGVDDRQIVAAIAWASFAAAGRVAEWLAAPLRDRIVTTR
jgi:hypothetical protein